MWYHRLQRARFLMRSSGQRLRWTKLICWRRARSLALPRIRICEWYGGVNFKFMPRANHRSSTYRFIALPLKFTFNFPGHISCYTESCSIDLLKHFCSLRTNLPLIKVVLSITRVSDLLAWKLSEKLAFLQHWEEAPSCEEKRHWSLQETRRKFKFVSVGGMFYSRTMCQ